MDILELAYGRYNGGQTVPAGSYFNPRTFCIAQFTTDGVLPPDGIFVRVDGSGTQTFAAIATSLNALLNTTYTAASFHACGANDSIANTGTMANDA